MMLASGSEETSTCPPSPSVRCKHNTGPRYSSRETGASSKDVVRWQALGRASGASMGLRHSPALQQYTRRRTLHIGCLHM